MQCLKVELRTDTGRTDLINWKIRRIEICWAKIWGFVSLLKLEEAAA